MDSRSEFLKHLRLVHFTLVVTALVLLVGSNLTPNFILENAYQQSVEIHRSAPVLWKWAKGKNIPDLGEQIAAVYQESPLYLVENAIAYGPLLGFLVDSHVASDSQQFLEDNIVSREENAPSTLEKFKGLWNELHRWSRLFVVTGWDGDNASVQLLPDNDRDFVIKSELRSGQKGAFLLNSRYLHLKMQPGQSDTWDLVIDFERSALDLKGCSVGEPGCFDLPDDWPEDFLSANETRLPIAKVRIPIKWKEFTEVDFQKEAIQELPELPDSWAPGTFDESFADLAQLASEVDSLQLDDLKNHFGKLRSEQGATIELLGAKVPLSALQTWGLLILVSVQLYFALHMERYLRVFAHKTRDDEYPWIGTYKSPPARAVFAITTSVIPVIATLFVMSANADPQTGWMQILVAWGFAAGSLAIAVFSFSQVIRIHQKQP